MKTFKCEVCNEKFETDRSDKECLEELVKSPWFIEGDEIGEICEDCFQKFKIYFDGLTEEDNKRIKGMVEND